MLRLAILSLGAFTQVSFAMLHVPDFNSYPGYSGNLAVSGTLHIEMSTDRTQSLVWNFTGLDPACVVGAADNVTNGCGIHVHTGTSCEVASDVGGHYFNSSSMTADPWLDIVYVAGISGASQGTATVNTGLTLSQLEGRAFVVHELAGGARIACGILAASGAAADTAQAMHTSVTASGFSSYPAYTGNLAVSGTVNISELNNTAQVLTWNLSGVDTACVAGAGDDVTNGCGIHVHLGTSCAVASEVGGHFFNTSTLSSDPWLDIVYVADSSGASQGSATVNTELALSELEGRAFVVHELAGGARVGCAVLALTAAPKVEDSAESSTAVPEDASSTIVVIESSSTDVPSTSASPTSEHSSDAMSTTALGEGTSSAAVAIQSSSTDTPTSTASHTSDETHSSNAMRMTATAIVSMSLLTVISCL